MAGWFGAGGLGGFDKLSPNGNWRYAQGPVLVTAHIPPFALSLSKGVKPCANPPPRVPRETHFDPKRAER